MNRDEENLQLSPRDGFSVTMDDSASDNTLTTLTNLIGNNSENKNGSQNQSQQNLSNPESESRDRNRKESRNMKILLQQENAELRGSSGLLKKTLGQTNVGIVKKVDEIQELRKKQDNLLENIEPWREQQNNELPKEPDRLQLDETGERRDAIFIFPEEIWSIIFENLTDWRDLLNCSKTCILFEKVLHPFKATYLFEQVFPLVFKHLPLNDILRCRSVSKTWHEVVDGYFENHQYFKPHDDNHADPRHPPFVNPLSEKKLDKALRLFRTNLNPLPLGQQIPYPFIGRSKALIIGFNNRAGGDGRMEVRFWNSLYRFLEAHGKQIWYFKVTLLKHEEFPIRMKKILFKFLTVDVFRLIPNLRKLHISGYLEYASDLSDAVPSPISASKLETLQIDIPAEISTPEPHQVIAAISNTYHNQLRKLHVDAKDWNNVFHLEWKNLTELHVEDLKVTDASFLQIKLPNLRKLGLNLSLEHWAFDKFLELINNVFVLNPINILRIGGVITKGFVASLQSNLYGPPTLKTLEVEHVCITNFSTCYAFLLRFPCLENINVFWRKRVGLSRLGANRSEIELRDKLDYSSDESAIQDERNGEVEIVEVKKYIYQGGARMYYSNIWELLPKLKVFTFQEDVYTRGGYENFWEQKRRSENSKS